MNECFSAFYTNVTEWHTIILVFKIQKNNPVISHTTNCFRNEHEKGKHFIIHEGYVQKWNME